MIRKPTTVAQAILSVKAIHMKLKTLGIIQGSEACSTWPIVRNKISTKKNVYKPLQSAMLVDPVPDVVRPVGQFTH